MKKNISILTRLPDTKPNFSIGQVSAPEIKKIAETVTPRAVVTVTEVVPAAAAVVGTQVAETISFHVPPVITSTPKISTTIDKPLPKLKTNSVIPPRVAFYAVLGLSACVIIGVSWWIIKKT